jgi:hypothetical protein
MKTFTIKLFNSLLLLMLFINLPAQEDNDNKKHEFTKRKTVSETYDFEKSGMVLLDNQFGDVKINVWSGSQVKLNISVESSADTEEDAQKMLDKVTLTYGKKGKDILSKSSLQNNDKWPKNGKKHNFSVHIHYDVYLPALTTLHIKNQFGNVVVPDYAGELTIYNQFGDLKAGNLTAVKKIKVAFGEADIKGMSSGRLEVEFAGKPLVLQNISGNVNMNFRFCNGGVYVFTAAGGNMTIAAEHSKLNVITGRSFNGQVDVKTSFGSFKNSSNISLNDKTAKPEYGPEFDRHLESNGGGSGSIKINGSFTDVVLSNQKEVFPAEKKDKGGKASAGGDDDDDGDEEDDDKDR